ncbi:ABC transporter permease, partial [Escherichia coli]|uniref:ABC transporter permease n=1 Tax=Escherichia coli TaxID=562 RepID=UPI0013D6ED5D
AHAVLGLPFVVITVSAALGGFDTTLLRAGASLGAAPVRVFATVTLPMMLPSVITGALLAFITSFDEVVTVIFLGGPAQRTLPREMF